ncbi:MAG: transporter substrate-binding domain-containing protein [Alphaproteobacteria bacterium]|nr:transporter substrate-binding domain-containing protein [Alphaproteobacteria bacterium]
MVKFLRSFCLAGLLFLMCAQAFALVEEKQGGLKTHERLWVTSFLNYPPFGQINKYGDGIDTAFQPLLDLIKSEAKIGIEYAVQDTYSKRMFGVVNGDIDLVLGAYYDSEEYLGMDMIYPSLLNNPLVVVTMPYKSLNIKTRDDLKNLKGAMDSRERLADYVSKDLKNYQIEKFDTSEKLYEQLFVGNVDYILTSRYYGALEQAKLGIRDMVLMSKQALWDMPLFIGVSKVTVKSDYITKTIKKVLKPHQEEIKSAIEQRVIEEIRRADEASDGVVPPSFVK